LRVFSDWGGAELVRRAQDFAACREIDGAPVVTGRDLEDPEDLRGEVLDVRLPGGHREHDDRAVQGHFAYPQSGIAVQLLVDGDEVLRVLHRLVELVRRLCDHVGER
jgi:hypothetical protein